MRFIHVADIHLGESEKQWEKFCLRSALLQILWKELWILFVLNILNILDKKLSLLEQKIILRCLEV